MPRLLPGAGMGPWQRLLKQAAVHCAVWQLRLTCCCCCYCWSPPPLLLPLPPIPPQLLLLLLLPRAYWHQVGHVGGPIRKQNVTPILYIATLLGVAFASTKQPARNLLAVMG